MKKYIVFALVLGALVFSVSQASALVSSTSVLTKGTISTEVTTIQSALKNLGYTITVDGSYGLKTETAVKTYQAIKGLPVTGIIDVVTKTSILTATPVVTTTPATITEIKAVQSALVSQGYLVGKVDGIIGPITTKAIQTYQKANSLPTTGKLDTATKTSVSKVVASTPISTRICLPTTAPWIQVTSPNGGETYTAGQQITVNWTSCNVTGNIAEINLIPVSGWGPGLGVTFIKDITNDGQEIISLPSVSDFSMNGASFGQYFKIEVVAGSSSTSIIKDSSDNLFTINGSINLPAGCTSAVGYSSTTGLSCGCNGTVYSTYNGQLCPVIYPAGCTSSVGYSTTTGLPCGCPAGCTSNVGYSSTTGLSCGCNGTVYSTYNGQLCP